MRVHQGLSKAMGVLSLFLAFSGAWAASQGDEDSFRFRKGTRWKYTGTAGTTKTSLIQEVFKISEGELFMKGEPATIYHLLMKTESDDPTGAAASLTTKSYLGVEGGYLVTGTLGGVPVRLYKLGSRKGDTWECTDGRLKSAPDQVFTHLGVETVAVPAGTFRNARHVQVEIQAEGRRHTGDFYIVPGVGIVKSEAVVEANGVQKRLLLELDRFEPPGDF
jgi:hypothetical protein